MKLKVCSILFWVMCFFALANAQEKQDSILSKGAAGLSEQEIKELTLPISALPNEKPIEAPSGIKAEDARSLAREKTLAEEEPKEIDLRYEIMPRGSRLPRWATGYMYGSNSYTRSLMVGDMRSATAGVSQNVGRYWTLDASVDFTKYMGLNYATFNTQANWHPNKYFSTTFFLSYMPGSFFSNYSISPSLQYGAYITLQTDTDLPFGVDLGGYDSYSPAFGHNVTPIVKPFVNVGGAKLGIDFGPMIKDAIWRANGGDHGGGGFNPIPKPMKVVPPVAPRR